MTNEVNNDEIDLREIVKILWDRKFWIVGFVGIVCAVTVFVVINMDNIYESKAVLRPTQNGASQMSSAISNLGGLASLAGINIGNSGTVSPYNAMNAIGSDDDFIYSFVTSNKLEPVIVDNYQEIAGTEKYKENQKFHVVKGFIGKFQFTEDSNTGLISASFQSKNREVTQKIVNLFLVELNSKYKQLEMKNLQERIDNYKNEIDKTSDITLKNKLAEVVAGLIQNKVLAQAQEFYGFDILVKPNVPDAMNKVKPKRAVICIVAFFLSFCISSVAVLAVDGLKNKR